MFPSTLRFVDFAHRNWSDILNEVCKTSAAVDKRSRFFHNFGLELNSGIQRVFSDDHSGRKDKDRYAAFSRSVADAVIECLDPHDRQLLESNHNYRYIANDAFKLFAALKELGKPDVFRRENDALYRALTVGDLKQAENQSTSEYIACFNNRFKELLDTRRDLDEKNETSEGTSSETTWSSDVAAEVPSASSSTTTASATNTKEASGREVVQHFRKIALVYGLNRKRNEAFFNTYSGREEAKLYSLSYNDLTTRILGFAALAANKKASGDTIEQCKALLAESNPAAAAASSSQQQSRRKDGKRKNKNNNEQRVGDSTKRPRITFTKQQRQQQSAQAEGQSPRLPCINCLALHKKVYTKHAGENCRFKPKPSSTNSNNNANRQVATHVTAGVDADLLLSELGLGGLEQ